MGWPNTYHGWSKINGFDLYEFWLLLLKDWNKDIAIDGLDLLENAIINNKLNKHYFPHIS